MTGARGSGKSVLVNKVLQDQSSVVTLELTPQTPVTDELLGEAILRALNITYTGAGLQRTPVVLQHLEAMSVPPILLVEVTDHCTGADLQSLLLRLKSWGADRKLVRLLTVLSSARAVFGLTIHLSELRTKTFTIPDRMEPEARALLRTLLQDHVHHCPETDLIHICTQVVSQVGTCPLDLTDLHQDVRLESKARGKLSHAALEHCVITLLQERRWAFWFALRTCMIQLARSDPLCPLCLQ